MCFGILFVYLCLFVPHISGLQDFEQSGHERIQLKDTSIHFRYSQGGKPPVLLVHGSPQHSRTWIHVGPIVAEKYTVIAPDKRGAGDSALSSSDNYTAPAAGEDLRAILDFLNIKTAYVMGHDKGVGLVTSLALEHPELVESLILAEYSLPGFGYSTKVTSPNPYENWQLAFFAVPDIATYFIQGREKEMLEWYFWHASYSGTESFSNELVERYTRSISKPGFLRAMFQYFAAAFTDAIYFNNKIAEYGKLRMPVLAMGGEASFAPVSALREGFEDVASDLQTAVVPKAGHWIADENPIWVAQRAIQFFEASSSTPSTVDLKWLEHTYTMDDGPNGNAITPARNGSYGAHAGR